MIMPMPFHKCIYGLGLQFAHSLLVSITAFLKQMLYFCRRNNREKFCKQKVTCKEQTDRSKIKTYFPNRGPVISTPRRWQVFPVNGGDYDHKTLEPHAYVNKNAHKKRNDKIAPHLS